jgi:aminoglycoside phosphotransferase family enzyme/predicted kinase
VTEPGGAPPGAAVRETHISLLFFVGDQVYKLKKPVVLDFLDFSTRVERERACRREVELNRRLAPDVYLGVLDVLGVDGEPCDHLVAMRRMPDERRLSTLVERGADVEGCVREVARAVATFHATAATSPAIAAAGSVAAVRSNWQSNFSTLRPFVGSVLDEAVAARVERRALRYLEGRAPLFAERIATGKIRDGHGDLLADDIFCLDDGPRILDCIEFDDRLRYGDVLADVAFLAMDLERVGDAALGARFLSRYRQFAGETYPETLAHHYLAYRAHVRAKVACLRVAQGDDAAGEVARRLLAMTDQHLNAGRVVLTLVGGLPGTGKSTLAGDLADRLAWSVVHSDELRKDLAGLGHTTRRGDLYGQGLYEPRATEATYRALLAHARTLLERGEPVILDASWSDRRWRDEARALAQATSSDLIELRCDVGRGTARQRLGDRALRDLDASDATAAVAERMASSFDAWETASTVHTVGSPAEALEAALRVVQTT